MLKLLLKKQFLEIFQVYFYDAKKNKARSRTSTAMYFVMFFLLVFGLLRVHNLFCGCESVAIRVGLPVAAKKRGCPFFDSVMAHIFGDSDFQSRRTAQGAFRCGGDRAGGSSGYSEKYTLSYDREQKRKIWRTKNE